MHCLIYHVRLIAAPKLCWSAGIRILLFALITLFTFAIYPTLLKQSITTINAQNNIHVVQYGDTLSAIASRYGVEPATIIQANGISNPNILRVGQQLIIPTNASIYLPAIPAQSSSFTKYEKDVPIESSQVNTSSPILSANPSSNCGTNLYTVRPGDTLSGLASIYHTTASQLRQCNGLTSDLIRVGQLLHVPGPRAVPTTPPDRRTVRTPRYP